MGLEGRKGAGRAWVEWMGGAGIVEGEGSHRLVTQASPAWVARGESSCGVYLHEAQGVPLLRPCAPAVSPHAWLGSPFTLRPGSDGCSRELLWGLF